MSALTDCHLFARWRGAMDLARGHARVGLASEPTFSFSFFHFFGNAGFLGADFLTFIFSATEPTFFDFFG